MRVVQILWRTFAIPLIHSVVNSINCLHEVLIYCQKDGFNVGVIGGETHDGADDFFAVVFVDEASAGELGVEAMTEDLGKASLVMVEAFAGCKEERCDKF